MRLDAPQGAAVTKESCRGMGCKGAGRPRWPSNGKCEADGLGTQGGQTGRAGPVELERKQTTDGHNLKGSIEHADFGGEGADVNLSDPEGWAPVHVVAGMRAEDLMECPNLQVAP